MNQASVSLPVPENLAASGSAFRPLRPECPVAFDSSRCLRLRSRYNDCGRCAQACPARVLRVTHTALELADGCLRCGQCSAICPTGALQTEGFAVDPPRAAGRETPLYVDCWKVPASGSPPDATRVPCLGGIALHQFVQWHTATEGRPIVLTDRGWCGQCGAGSRANQPAQEALDAARALLTALGVAEQALPHLESKPLPRDHMLNEIPDLAAAQPMSRRQFFTGVTRNAVRAIAPAAARRHDASAEARRPRPAKIEPTARSQLLAQAAVLSKQHGRPLPAELFPALRVSDACRNHGVCAAICPAGGLQCYESDGRSVVGIAFDAEACIACGDCTRACPEKALALLAQGDGEAPRGAMILTRWTRRECRDCGYEFADSGSSTVCPTCRKTRELARTAFSRLFGAADNEPMPKD